MARPRKEANELRTAAVRTYMTASERMRLEHAAAVRGISLSDYTRALLLKKPLQTTAPEASPLDHALMQEIRRIGVNINQAVRRFHQTDRMPPELPKAAATIERLLRQKLLEAPDGPKGRR